MMKVGLVAAPPCTAARTSYSPAYKIGGEWRTLEKRRRRPCSVHQVKVASPVVKAHLANRPSTYTSRISTEIPLYESSSASFDQYLEDKPRVVKAIFPENKTSQRLSEEEWRIHMVPIEFMLFTTSPVIHMRLRCTSKGIEYPIDVPRTTSKVLQLDIIKWELRGVNQTVVKPTEFSLGIKGALYPDRRGPLTKIRGQLQITLSFIPPAVLVLVPENVIRDVAESMLKSLTEEMEHKVTHNLQTDYTRFKRERLLN